MVLLIIFLFTTVGCVRTPYRDSDKILMTASAITLAIDAAQTITISKDPYRKEENNILGEKPTRRQTISYFSACILGTYAISRYWLDGTGRTMFLTIVPTMELGTIRRNQMMGVSINGRF